MKIIKHAREAHVVHPAPPNTSNATVTFTPAVGQLLGIDSNGTLEVSNAFGLPSGTLGGSTAETDGTESRGVKAGTILFSPSFTLFLGLMSLETISRQVLDSDPLAHERPQRRRLPRRILHLDQQRPNPRDWWLPRCPRWRANQRRWTRFGSKDSADAQSRTRSTSRGSAR